MCPFALKDVTKEWVKIPPEHVKKGRGVYLQLQLLLHKDGCCKLKKKKKVFSFFQELYNSSWCQIESRAKVELPDTTGQETPHYVQTGTGAKAWDARDIKTLYHRPADRTIQSLDWYYGSSYVCVLQDSIIEEVRALWERRRKAGGLKEMLQDVTKLTQKLRFIVEEVWQSAWLVYVFNHFVLLFHFLAYPVLTFTLLICSHSTQHQISLCGCLATTSVSHTLEFKRETCCTPAPRRPEASTVAR